MYNRHMTSINIFSLQVVSYCVIGERVKRGGIGREGVMGEGLVRKDDGNGGHGKMGVCRWVGVSVIKYRRLWVLWEMGACYRACEDRGCGKEWCEEEGQFTYLLPLPSSCSVHLPTSSPMSTL